MKRFLLILTVSIVLLLSFVVLSHAATAQDALDLGKSLLAKGYPSSEYTTLKEKYDAAKANQSAGNITALENASKAFMTSLTLLVLHTR